MISLHDVSVVVPVYQATPFFALAIESVLSQSPGELIVVDDGSPDPVAPVTSSQAAVVHHRLENNCGPSAARNRGVALASKPWLAFLDSDDLWPAESLKRSAQALERTGADLVLGQTRYVTSRGEPDPQRLEPVHLPVFSAMFGSTSLFRSVPINESLRMHEDADFYVRVKERGFKVEKHPEVVLLYRQREGSLTHGRDQAEKKRHLLDLVRIHRERQRTRASE